MSSAGHEGVERVEEWAHKREKEGKELDPGMACFVARVWN